jgi:hypothetical protein
MTSGNVKVPSQFIFSGKNPPLTTLAALQQLANTGNTLQNRYVLTFGTTSGKIDTIIANAYELAASGTNNHDFFDGSVPDIFGDANGLQTIRYLGVFLVSNSDGSANGASITIGNAATPLTMNMGGTATYQLFQSSPTMQMGSPAGFTVDNTHKLLKIVNDDAVNKLTYWITAAGRKI